MLWLLLLVQFWLSVWKVTECIHFLSPVSCGKVSRGDSSSSFLPAKVPAGLPMVSLPPFQVTTGNTTFTFLEISRDIGSGILVVPFVSILGNVAIAKAFGKAC